MSSLSFKGHTVVVTGAGGGLGKAYVFSNCVLKLVFLELIPGAVIHYFSHPGVQTS